jgi:chromosome segregation ATPase
MFASVNENRKLMLEFERKTQTAQKSYNDELVKLQRVREEHASLFNDVSQLKNISSLISLEIKEKQDFIFILENSKENINKEITTLDKKIKDMECGCDMLSKREITISTNIVDAQERLLNKKQLLSDVEKKLDDVINETQRRLQKGKKKS